MPGQVLHIFERELLVKKVGYRRHPKRVRRKIRWQPSLAEPPLHHAANVMARHRDVGEPLLLAHRGREERAALGAGLRVRPGRCVQHASADHVLVNPTLKIVRDRNLPHFIALLPKGEDPLIALVAVVVDVESADGAGPRGRVEKNPEDGPVAEADDALGVDDAQELPHLLVGNDGGRAFRDLQALGLGDGGRIEDDDVPLNQEVEKLPQAREVLLLFLKASGERLQVPADIAGG